MLFMFVYLQCLWDVIIFFYTSMETSKNPCLIFISDLYAGENRSKLIILYQILIYYCSWSKESINMIMFVRAWFAEFEVTLVIIGVNFSQINFHGFFGKHFQELKLNSVFNNGIQKKSILFIHCLHLQVIKEVSSVFSRWRKVRENEIKKK